MKDITTYATIGAVAAFIVGIVIKIFAK